MIVPDANLLLHAYDSSSPYHEVAKGWWKVYLEGDEIVGLTYPVLFAFVRVGTKTPAYATPMSVPEAARVVSSWLDRRSVRVLREDAQHFERVIALLVEAGSSGGNLVTDAQIAAIAIAHQATVHTNDRDFQRFKGLKTFYPLD